ncbi:transmembrane protein 69 [Sphaerodactylus townsendi]|uniref:Transmembrane protein 69 n=1 Tax=Sphaerodactylus townsendi TaxID=933632 RepID=A0ACB8F4I5_9SAUR|nr:transmembrane protein 69 [Sphaerodactylus townsendi]XP_048352194.1 transmembrane protein 69 [Sphaerodactylus townsendi]XP_048352195.1 transmembrane protein 69 [Sphaerodactylus townsendi]
MLHLLNRYYFQGSSKMAYLQIFLQPRSRAACSFIPLQGIVTGLPKPQLFRHTSAGLIKAQGFHSSRCNWKKKKPPEPAPRQLGLLRYDMESLKFSPKPALYLSVAGLIPFVSIPLLMAIQETSYPELVFAQIAYGASIVSFLGGIRWGFALPEGSPAKPDWINLANSIVPPVLAWIALLCKDSSMEAGILVIMGLGIALHYDLALLPTYPSWFKALRAIVTLVAVGSLVATLCIVNIYPEKHLAPATNKVEE